MVHIKYNVGSNSEDPKCCKPRIKYYRFWTNAFQTQKQFQKVRKESFPCFSFILELRILATKKTWFVCAPPVFFLSKETCYWLVQALSITQYIVQPDTQPRVTILMENWREILYTYTQYIRVYVYTYIYTLW